MLTTAQHVKCTGTMSYVPRSCTKKAVSPFVEHRGQRGTSDHDIITHAHSCMCRPAVHNLGKYHSCAEMKYDLTKHYGDERNCDCDVKIRTSSGRAPSATSRVKYVLHDTRTHVPVSCRAEEMYDAVPVKHDKHCSCKRCRACEGSSSFIFEQLQSAAFDAKRLVDAAETVETSPATVTEPLSADTPAVKPHTTAVEAANSFSATLLAEAQESLGFTPEQMQELVHFFKHV